MSALEQCTAQGEWTNGPGRESIPRLQAVATRLGHPVGAPERQVTSSAQSRLLVVQQREQALARRLAAMRWPGVHVIMDRRRDERRTMHRAGAPDRRRGSRRRSAPASWDTFRFLIVATQKRAS